MNHMWVIGARHALPDSTAAPCAACGTVCFVHMSMVLGVGRVDGFMCEPCAITSPLIRMDITPEQVAHLAERYGPKVAEQRRQYVLMANAMFN